MYSDKLDFNRISYFGLQIENDILGDLVNNMLRNIKIFFHV